MPDIYTVIRCRPQDHPAYTTQDHFQDPIYRQGAAALAVVSDGGFITDCVDANDVPFSGSFPYLAGPH